MVYLPKKTTPPEAKQVISTNKKKTGKSADASNKLPVKMTRSADLPAYTGLFNLNHLLGRASPYHALTEYINADSMMGLPAFFQGVRLVADTMARADWSVLDETSDGDMLPATDDASYPLLTRKANPYQTIYSFLSTLIANGKWAGNGYGLIDRDEAYKPVAFYNLDSRDVYPFWETTGGRLTTLYYGVNTQRGQIALPAEDVIHFKSVSLHTGVEGLSIPDTCRLIFNEEIARVRYANLFFRHGAHIEKVVSVPEWLDPEHQAELRDSLHSLNEGISNAHRLLVLMGGAKIESLPLNNEDSQFIQSREFSLLDVANIVGIPASKLGARGSFSYGSLSEDNQSVMGDCYDALFTQLEQELTAKLIPSYLPNRYVVADRESLFVGDPDYQKRVVELYQGEAISWQEMRKALKRTTQRKGDYVADKQPEPQQPAEQQAPQQDEPQQDAAPQQDVNLQRGIRLMRSALEQISDRITKSGKPLSDHEETIRAKLPDDADKVIESLRPLEQEWTQCLSEQRKEVMTQWDTTTLLQQIWN